MLEVTHLTKYYKKFCAVDHLSFAVNSGEIVGLLGPNGAGKTTVLRCIANILRFNEGAIAIGGYDLVTQPRQAKSCLAFVPEVPSLYDLLTVREHLKFVAMCFDTTDRFDERCGELLRRFDLDEKADELVATLSKGMKQKLAIACAFIHDAKLLLLDEPLIGIDPRGVAEVKSHIQNAKETGCAILVSTHLLDTAERLCDRVLIVQRGVMQAAGTLEELRQRAHVESGATLEEVFLKLTEEADDERPALSEL